MIQNISDAKKAFRLFGSKTKDILDSEYLNKLKATGSKLSINASKGKPVRFSRIGGSKDDLDLVLVRLRFFSLDRDGISFHVLSEVCNLEDISQKWKDNFNSTRSSLNKFLDSPTTITHNGINMTNRELLETFQYGDVIHFERFQEYSQIAGNNIFPLTKENFLFELENIILTFIHQISYVDCINREELQRLGEVIDF